MRRRVVIANAARRDLRRLDPDVARRVVAAITRFAETERGDVPRLHGGDNEFRLRVGDWRVRFLMSGANDLIEVVRILPRGRAYRD